MHAPIVRPVNPPYEIVAGLHRLAAVKLLGWKAIEATLVVLEGLRAELAEIDENLIRNELTALERADTLLHRKKLYEAKHPETKHGGAPEKAGGGKKAKTAETATFAEDTSKKTGAARTVREDLQIANNLDDDVKELLRDAPLAEFSRLSFLRRIPIPSTGGSCHAEDRRD